MAGSGTTATMDSRALASKLLINHGRLRDAINSISASMARPRIAAVDMIISIKGGRVGESIPRDKQRRHESFINHPTIQPSSFKLLIPICSAIVCITYEIYYACFSCYRSCTNETSTTLFVLISAVVLRATLLDTLPRFFRLNAVRVAADTMHLRC